MSVQNYTFNKKGEVFNFVLLELKKPSKYTPINLPKLNSEVPADTWLKSMGWGTTSYPKGSLSEELRSIDVQMWNKKKCKVDKPFTLCALGKPGKSMCIGDWGDPLIEENGEGDQDDVLIGLMDGTPNCMYADGGPNFYSRVSAVTNWINSIIQAE